MKNTDQDSPLCLQMDWSVNTLFRLLCSYDFQTVIDIGAGESNPHSQFLKTCGKDVFSVDLHTDADYVGDFLTAPIERTFDVVWCSHVLEHQRNIGSFLERIHDCLEEGGILALTVPTDPDGALISGHINRFNAGFLCYHLILAGFDCSEARIFKSYDLSLILRKKSISGGDIGSSAGYDIIETIAQYFPFPVAHGSSAIAQEINWGKMPYQLPKAIFDQLHGKVLIRSKWFDEDITF